MYNQNSDLMKQEKFMLPTMIEGDFSAEELAEDADGLQMSFQRVKIPAGGTLQFEMPSDDPDNPDYEKNLVGVILHNHATCAYWPAGSEYDDDTTPLCSSVDGKVGIGTPGGACAACVMNRFGSAPDGSKGKACKNMRVLYLLRSGEYMPLQVNLPPTSIKPFKEFLNRAFMLRRRATYGSIVQIGLKRENNGTNDYSVATFKLLQDFQGEELAQIRAYANSFKEQARQRAAASAKRLASAARRRADEDALSEADEKLLAALYALRKRLAAKQKLPAYMVFNDSTLRQMALKKPLSVEELLNIPGVGEKKAARYGQEFLSVIEDMVSSR